MVPLAFLRPSSGWRELLQSFAQSSKEGVGKPGSHYDPPNAVKAPPEGNQRKDVVAMAVVESGLANHYDCLKALRAIGLAGLPQFAMP